MSIHRSTPRGPLAAVLATLVLAAAACDAATPTMPISGLYEPQLPLTVENQSTVAVQISALIGDQLQYIGVVGGTGRATFELAPYAQIGANVQLHAGPPTFEGEDGQAVADFRSTWVSPWLGLDGAYWVKLTVGSAVTNSSVTIGTEAGEIDP